MFIIFLECLIKRKMCCSVFLFLKNDHLTLAPHYVFIKPKMYIKIVMEAKILNLTSLSTLIEHHLLPSFKQ